MLHADARAAFTGTQPLAQTGAQASCDALRTMRNSSYAEAGSNGLIMQGCKLNTQPPYICGAMLAHGADLSVCNAHAAITRLILGACACALLWFATATGFCRCFHQATVSRWPPRPSLAAR
jgi:hypothetical protein